MLFYKMSVFFVLILCCMVFVTHASVCDPNPCQNSGTCNPNGASYTCACVSGTSGTNCEIDNQAPQCVSGWGGTYEVTSHLGDCKRIHTVLQNGTWIDNSGSAKLDKIEVSSSTAGVFEITNAREHCFPVGSSKVVYYISDNNEVNTNNAELDPNCPSDISDSDFRPELLNDQSSPHDKLLIIETYTDTNYDERDETIQDIRDYLTNHQLRLPELEWFYLDSSTQEGDIFSDAQLDQYDQIWIMSLYSPSVNTAANGLLHDRVADWYLRRKTANIDTHVILDSRFVNSYGYGSGQPRNSQYFYNVYENFRVRGKGGLFVGTDHDIFIPMANRLLTRAGFNTFSGNFNLNFIPADDINPIISWPKMAAKKYMSPTWVSAPFNRYFAYSLQDYSTPGRCPYGLQPNGKYLYTLAWHSGSPANPGISTTIPGGVNQCYVPDNFNNVVGCSFDVVVKAPVNPPVKKRFIVMQNYIVT